MIADRRWRWLGHVLRLENINNFKVSLICALTVGEEKVDPRQLGVQQLRVNGGALALPRGRKLSFGERLQGGQSWCAASHTPMCCNEDDDDDDFEISGV